MVYIELVRNIKILGFFDTMNSMKTNHYNFSPLRINYNSCTLLGNIKNVTYMLFF